ncbi:hypothetical protein VB712_07770 [Spirulina sp. CCNP1310]|uniref:hypothetical protein n=1 Tax=Spirulina sp. CCNP1310 TaxID=3110249 RepID=UPI002B1FCE86|nr:hypothetical protein [Spirulina sp. CCNP1310]MEA5419124.1 hypothetical protein [Spirulina sp. CCNP1310]
MVSLAQHLDCRLQPFPLGLWLCHNLNLVVNGAAGAIAPTPRTWGVKIPQT